MPRARSFRSRVTRRPRRRGFSLVEVVVALVLLAIAALGVASTATFVARLAATARALALATRATAQVVDSLRSVPCTSLGSGSVATPAGTVRWAIAAPAGARRIHAVLTPSSARVANPVVEETIVPCE